MFMPVIERDKCDNCRACAHICPKLVFEPDSEEVSVSNPVHCTGCESCSAVCKEDAITVKEI